MKLSLGKGTPQRSLARDKSQLGTPALCPCRQPGVTRPHPDPSKAQGFPQFQDSHLPWDNQRSQRCQEECKVTLKQVRSLESPPSQQNSPTKRTSRSDFTGLLLKVFSTGHSFSWLQAQTLDVLLSCKSHRTCSRQPGTPGTGLGRLHRVCRGVFLVF